MLHAVDSKLPIIGLLKKIQLVAFFVLEHHMEHQNQKLYTLSHISLLIGYSVYQSERLQKTESWRMFTVRGIMSRNESTYGVICAYFYQGHSHDVILDNLLILHGINMNLRTLKARQNKSWLFIRKNYCICNTVCNNSILFK